MSATKTLDHALSYDEKVVAMRLWIDVYTSAIAEANSAIADFSKEKSDPSYAGRKADRAVDEFVRKFFSRQ